MVFPYVEFYAAINLLVWVGESYLDFSADQVQPFYIYPVLIASLFTPIQNLASIAPLVPVPFLLYLKEIISYQDLSLATIFLFSISPYPVEGLVTAAVISPAYLYASRRYLGEARVKAPLGLLTVTVTYALGAAI